MIFTNKPYQNMGNKQLFAFHKTVQIEVSQGQFVSPNVIEAYHICLFQSRAH